MAERLKTLLDQAKKLEAARDALIPEAALIKTPVLVTKDNDRGAIVHPSSKLPGQWQVSFWDDRGFFGDTTRKTKHDAIRLAFDDGYRHLDHDGVFKEISLTEKFINGIIGFINWRNTCSTSLINS